MKNYHKLSSLTVSYLFAIYMKNIHIQIQICKKIANYPFQKFPIYLMYTFVYMKNILIQIHIHIYLHNEFFSTQCILDFDWSMDLFKNKMLPLWDKNFSNSDGQNLAEFRINLFNCLKSISNSLFVAGNAEKAIELKADRSAEWGQVGVYEPILRHWFCKLQALLTNRKSLRWSLSLTRKEKSKQAWETSILVKSQGFLWYAAAIRPMV